MLAHLVACTIGLFLDRLIGDPPKWPHPVRWIGRMIQLLTKLLNKGALRKVKGGFTVLLVMAFTGIIVFAIIYTAYSISVVFGILVESISIAVALSQKSLKQAAMDVYKPLEQGAIDEARTKLSWIVGRDTLTLNESNITRGVVETVSENTSDGITAPLFWAFLFGGTGAWIYKAVNTLDSMIAYKNDTFKDFGYVAAYTDDIFNWIPSRITGLLILLCTPNTSDLSLKQRLTGWKKDAKKHPSPNSGYLEAATAYQLGIQLGGTNYYKGIKSERAVMGINTASLTKEHIRLTIVQMNIVTLWFWMFGVIIGGIFIVA